MNNTSDRVVLVNHDAAAAGEYAIAYRLITIGVMLVAGSNSVMVPRLYREPAGRPAVRSAVALNAKAALVGIVATALCLLVAHGILPDAEFTSLPLAVLLLSSVIFARATSMPLLDALTASGEQHVRTRILVGAAVANLAANLALVSTFGLWAAVGSTLASEGLVVWLSARRVARTPTHERSE